MIAMSRDPDRQVGRSKECLANGAKITASLGFPVCGWRVGYGQTGRSSSPCCSQYWEGCCLKSLGSLILFPHICVQFPHGHFCIALPGLSSDFWNSVVAKCSINASYFYYQDNWLPYFCSYCPGICVFLRDQAQKNFREREAVPHWIKSQGRETERERVYVSLGVCVCVCAQERGGWRSTVQLSSLFECTLSLCVCVHVPML